MTYEETSNLMNDMILRGRIKVAGLKFATYILNEDASVSGHASRYRWAQGMGSNPDSVAVQVQPLVVMDPAVQSDGANVSDAALQNAVEGVVNKLF